MEFQTVPFASVIGKVANSEQTSFLLDLLETNEPLLATQRSDRAKTMQSLVRPWPEKVGALVLRCEQISYSKRWNDVGVQVVVEFPRKIITLFQSSNDIYEGMKEYVDILARIMSQSLVRVRDVGVVAYYIAAALGDDGFLNLCVRVNEYRKIVSLGDDVSAGMYILLSVIVARDEHIETYCLYSPLIHYRRSRPHFNPYASLVQPSHAPYSESYFFERIPGRTHGEIFSRLRENKLLYHTFFVQPAATTIRERILVMMGISRGQAHHIVFKTTVWEDVQVVVNRHQLKMITKIRHLKIPYVVKYTKQKPPPTCIHKYKLTLEPWEQGDLEPCTHENCQYVM